jgi:hypothetical protein
MPQLWHSVLFALKHEVLVFKQWDAISIVAARISLQGENSVLGLIPGTTDNLAWGTQII